MHGSEYHYTYIEAFLHGSLSITPLYILIELYLSIFTSAHKDNGIIKNKLLFPPTIKRLQRINSPTRLPTPSSLAIPLSSLPNPVISCLPQPNVPDILVRDTLSPLSGHQVIRNMFEMMLDTRRTQLPVMAQLSQFFGVLFEVALELLALDKFLTDFARTGFLHGKSGYGAEGVGHTIPECLDLLHFEVIGFDFVAELGLALDDLREDGFIMLCGGD